jgi:hypothetical protein
MSMPKVAAVLIVVPALAWAGADRVTAQAPAPAPAPAPAATPQKESPAATSPAVKPRIVPAKRFPSAEEATAALVAALRAHDSRALVQILGSEARPLVSSGDPVADRQIRDAFLAKYDAANALVPGANGAMTLQIGQDDWPFPIPLVKDGEQWRFDARAGREEILARRIGRNELFTMQTCLAYVDAQREYYEQDRRGNGVLQYAQKFASTPGKRDGLYWETKAGEPLSPLGSLVAQARKEGYRRDQAGGPTPYHGYFFRILTSQGADAADGAYDYVVRGQMIGGFALVAYPAQYGVSGVMTFIVNQDGVVYEKDLGPTTATLAGAMKAFNPDKSWAKSDVVNVENVEN